MSWTRIGIRLTTAAAVVSTLVATSTIWLILTSPRSVATAVNQHDIGPIAQALASALVRAISGLLAYL